MAIGMKQVADGFVEKLNHIQTIITDLDDLHAEHKAQLALMQEALDAIAHKSAATHAYLHRELITLLQGDRNGPASI